MRYVKGTELSREDRAKALNRYMRYTRQHKPAWARKEWKDGQPYPLQFDSDADWLAHTLFPVKNDGGLTLRNLSCQSNPTWPDNPELRKGVT